jgi:hypothetical protein
MAATLTSGSAVEKEKDRIAFYHLLVRSFLQLLGTYMFLLIAWVPLCGINEMLPGPSGSSLLKQKKLVITLL